MTAQSLARILSGLALRRPVTVLLAGLAVAVTGIVLAAQLSLQTDLSELLPQNRPSVIALKRLSARLGGTGNVTIALESIDGKPDALRAYVPQLVKALREQLGNELQSIKYQKKEVTDFYTKYAAYYAKLDDLSRWADQLAVIVSKRANPAYIDLEDSDADVRQLVDEVRAAREKQGPTNEADPASGLLMTEGGRLAAVFVRPSSNTLDLASSAGVLHRIEAVVDGTQPEQHGVHVAGYTGSIPLALHEVDSVKRDIVDTAILVVLGVGLIIALYFLGVRELMLMSGAVLIGAAVALGFAFLWIGHVNAQTAFLGSIIVGTGINYGIIFLDRYRQARVRDSGFAEALEDACAQTLRATWIAAAATAVSFGVLAAGEVESFHQFGWIGGIGILACWIATFTVVPACIVLADARRTPRALPGFRPLTSVFRGIGHVAERAPTLVIGVTAAVVIACGVVAVHARHHVVETNLRKLGTSSARTSGIEKLDNRLRHMDDRSSTPSVIATDSREDTVPICEQLNARAKTDLKGAMYICYSINDLFPRDLDRRRPVIEKLKHSLELVDEEDLKLTPDEQKELEQLKTALDQPPPTDADLPPTLKEYFVERDGSIGKLAYVEPHDEHIESNLYRFTDAIRSIKLPNGKVVESSGELVVFADVLRAMRRDATKLTIAAALLVLLVLAGITRRIGSFTRVAIALLSGVVVMAGVAVLLGEKLNFFNFVALPTTFGIGIDYAINIEERIRQRGREHLPEALAESGPAVLLASMTSIIGYASLLTADSKALSSFGALAIVGELACVVIAIVLVPALWAVRRRRT